MAIDVATGEQRWRHKSKVAPLTLAADDDRVYFHDDEKVVCLDRKNGNSLWDSAPSGRRKAVTDRKSTRLNSSHVVISYAVFCLKKKNNTHNMSFKEI